MFNVGLEGKNKKEEEESRNLPKRMRMALWVKVRKLIRVTDVAPSKGWVHKRVKYGTYAKCDSCSTHNVFKFSAAKEVTKLRCAECRAKGSLHILDDYRGFSFNHEEKRCKILDVDVYGFDLEDDDVTLDFKWEATMMDGSKIGTVLEGTLNDNKCLYFDRTPSPEIQPMVAEPEKKEEEEEEEEEEEAEEDDDDEDDSQNKDHEYDSTDEENAAGNDADDEDEIKEDPGAEDIEAYWIMNDED